MHASPPINFDAWITPVQGSKMRTALQWSSDRASEDPVNERQFVSTANMHFRAARYRTPFLYTGPVIRRHLHATCSIKNT